MDVQTEQNLTEAMESQRASLESEAFSKASAPKTTRSNPFCRVARMGDCGCG